MTCGSTGYSVNTIVKVNLDLKSDGLTNSLEKEPMREKAIFVYQYLSETTVWPFAHLYVCLVTNCPVQFTIRLHKLAELCVFAPLLICIILQGLKTTQTLAVNKLCYQQPQLILSEIPSNVLRTSAQWNICFLSTF